MGCRELITCFWQHYMGRIRPKKLRRRPKDRPMRWLRRVSMRQTMKRPVSMLKRGPRGAKAVVGTEARLDLHDTLQSFGIRGHPVDSSQQQTVVNRCQVLWSAFPASSPPPEWDVVTPLDRLRYAKSDWNFLAREHDCLLPNSGRLTLRARYGYLIVCCWTLLQHRIAYYTSLQRLVIFLVLNLSSFSDF